MITLDEAVALVVIQFLFSKAKAVPPAVLRFKCLPDEKPEQRQQRVNLNGAVSGVMDIDSPERCSLQMFVAELEAASYVLADAFCQRRLDERGQASHMVRFVFVRRSQAAASDSFRRSYYPLREALRQLCTSALWKARVYLNPYLREGEYVVSQNSVSINLAARMPLFRPDGKPVMEWDKDDEGKRVGGAPRPLKPHCSLCIVGRAIDLLV